MDDLVGLILVCLLAPLFAVFELLWYGVFKIVLLVGAVAALLLLPIHLLGYGVLYDREDASMTDGQFSAACKYFNYAGSTEMTTPFESLSARRLFLPVPEGGPRLTCENDVAPHP